MYDEASGPFCPRNEPRNPVWPPSIDLTMSGTPMIIPIMGTKNIQKRIVPIPVFPAWSPIIIMMKPPTKNIMIIPIPAQSLVMSAISLNSCEPTRAKNPCSHRLFHVLLEARCDGLDISGCLCLQAHKCLYSLRSCTSCGLRSWTRRYSNSALWCCSRLR